MNVTIFLSLVIALAAIYLLKQALASFMMKKEGRQALAEVGKRALTKLPEYIRLSRVESPAWKNEALVQQEAGPLLRCGFQDVGVYSVDRMPGVLIWTLCEPQACVAAHIYDHPRAGSWIEMVTRYSDGSSHAVTTMPPTGMKHPEWFRKIQADKATPTDQIYQRYLAMRQQQGIKAVAAGDVVREFEDAYHQLALWRQEAGISPQEVAHVAVKWVREKQARAETIG
jgi:hypothetical protein